MPSGCFVIQIKIKSYLLNIWIATAPPRDDKVNLESQNNKTKKSDFTFYFIADATKSTYNQWSNL